MGNGIMMKSKTSKQMLILVIYLMIMVSKIETVNVLEVQDYFSDLGFENDPLSPTVLLNPIPPSDNLIEFGKWYNYFVQENCATPTNATEGKQFAILSPTDITIQCVDPTPFKDQMIRITFNYQTVGVNDATLYLVYIFPYYINSEVGIGCKELPNRSPCYGYIGVTSFRNTWQTMDHTFQLYYAQNAIGFCLFVESLVDGSSPTDYVVIDNFGLQGVPDPNKCPPPHSKGSLCLQITPLDP
jgi:hypothetical protein